MTWDNTDYDLSAVIGIGNCMDDSCIVCMSDGDCYISSATISGDGAGSEWVQIEEPEAGVSYMVGATWWYAGDLLEAYFLGISVHATITVERGTQVFGPYVHTFKVEYECEGGKGGNCWYSIPDWIVGTF